MNESGDGLLRFPSCTGSLASALAWPILDGEDLSFVAALMADELLELLKAVRDESSFIAFVRAFQADREAADAEMPALDGAQGGWANGSIATFIERGIAWVEDSDFGSRPGPKPSNPWALFAGFLWAGRGHG